MLPIQYIIIGEGATRLILIKWRYVKAFRMHELCMNILFFFLRFPNIERIWRGSYERFRKGG